MPSLVVPGAVLVRLIMGPTSSPEAVNVFGARKVGGGGIDQAVANTLGAAVKSAFTSSGYAALVPTSKALISVGVRDIASPNNPEFTDSGAAVAGTAAAGKPLPGQLAICITLRTARAGKSYRGRSYLGCWHDSALANTGAATPAAQTAAINFVQAVDTAMTASGLDLAIVSRKLLSTEPVTLVQSRDVLFETIRGRARPGI